MLHLDMPLFSENGGTLEYISQPTVYGMPALVKILFKPAWICIRQTFIRGQNYEKKIGSLYGSF